jgi:hypothetical protein
MHTQTKTKKVRSFGAAFVVAALLIPGAHGYAASITEQEARDFASDAYVYLYPLVTMDITRRQMVNVERPEGFHSPMNTFLNMSAYPSADMRVVVRPNFDTLYSSAWLDLTREPVVVSVPNTAGRYYLLPMLDMWSDVFASPGWRTTGTEAGNFLVTPPGWTANVPAEMSQIKAPTPYVWIIGRTKTDGPPDYDAVHQIQAGFKITPLSRWGKAAEAVVGKVDPTMDMRTSPKALVDTMSGEKYFTYAAELLKVNPPHSTDQPILAQMKRLGLEAGKSLDFAALDRVVQKAMQAAPEQGQQLMKWKVATLARVANGWSVNTDTMGVYGNYYLKRAIIAQVGLGANLPEDAIYPLNLGDEAGRPLSGGNKYVLHFDRDDLPPVGAFWSVTLYDTEGFQVANVLNRFAVSSWMPFQHNADGSLDLYFQNESPGRDKEANWLPAPKGHFNLTMRLYSPKSDALTGKWNPPPVRKVEGSVEPMPQ